jgi:hypothetical protein
MIGCGGLRQVSRPTTTTTAPIPAEVLAGRVLLQPGDFPAGWTRVSTPSSYVPAPEKGTPACPGQPRETGEELVLSSGEFRSPDGAFTVSSSAIAYKSAADRGRHAAWLNSAAGAACSETTLGRYVAGPQGYSGLTVRYVPPQAGQSSELAGLMEQHYYQANSAGRSVPHLVRSLSLEFGRVEASIVITAVGTTVPAGLERSFTSAVIAHSHS